MLGAAEELGEALVRTVNVKVIELLAVLQQSFGLPQASINPVSPSPLSLTGKQARILEALNLP